MPPDLNSLPPSRSTSSSPLQQRAMGTPPEASSTGAGMGSTSPSRRSSSVSLAAAATINAADISRRSSTSANNRASPQASRVHERRRSAVPMNLNLNDPAMPAPGELSGNDRRLSTGNGSAFRTASPTSRGGSPIVATGDPHHQRAPSLGELHQELEQEQEAQVNRLLLMIRQQQTQLQQLQQQQQQQQSSQHQSIGGTAVIDDSTPTSERSGTFPTLPPARTPSHRSSSHRRHGSSSARRGSSQASPALGSQAESASNVSSDLGALGGGAGEAVGRQSSRDDSTFYQAETAALTRENQMLRLRIRELERQVSELTTSSTHTPSTSSQLTTPLSANETGPRGNSEVATSSNEPAVEPEKS